MVHGKYWRQLWRDVSGNLSRTHGVGRVIHLTDGKSNNCCCGVCAPLSSVGGVDNLCCGQRTALWPLALNSEDNLAQGAAAPFFMRFCPHTVNPPQSPLIIGHLLITF